MTSDNKVPQREPVASGQSMRKPQDQRDDFGRVLSPVSLRLLVAVEELGGVSAAARSLKVSQPAASRMIAAMERCLGCLLLQRTALGSSLTAEGLALTTQARFVLSAYDQLETVASELGGGKTTSLRIAASRTVGEQLVPRWLGALAEVDPELKVVFHVDNSDAVIESVRAGKAVIGFVELPAAPQDLAQEVLAQDRLILVAPPGHSWAGRSISAAELAAAPLVERESGSGTRGVLDLALPRRSDPIAEFDSNTAIVRAVAAGVGPAVLSELAVTDSLNRGEIISIDWAGPTLERPITALWQKALDSSRVVRRVLDVVRAYPRKSAV